MNKQMVTTHAFVPDSLTADSDQCRYVTQQPRERVGYLRYCSLPREAHQAADQPAPRALDAGRNALDGVRKIAESLRDAGLTNQAASLIVYADTVAAAQRQHTAALAERDDALARLRHIVRKEGIAVTSEGTRWCRFCGDGWPNDADEHHASGCVIAAAVSQPPVEEM